MLRADRVRFGAYVIFFNRYVSTSCLGCQSNVHMLVSLCGRQHMICRYWRSAVGLLKQVLRSTFITNEAQLDVELSIQGLMNLVGAWKEFDLSPYTIALDTLVRITTNAHTTVVNLQTNLKVSTDCLVLVMQGSECLEKEFGIIGGADAFKHVQVSKSVGLVGV
jgi:hypothetical protein